MVPGKPIRMVGPSCSSNRGRGSRGTEPRPHPSLGLADHPGDRGVALGVDGGALAGDVGVDDVAGGVAGVGGAAGAEAAGGPAGVGGVGRRGVAVVGGADGAEAAEGPAGVVGLDDLGVVGLLDGGDAGHGSCLSLCVYPQYSPLDWEVQPPGGSVAVNLGEDLLQFPLLGGAL